MAIDSTWFKRGQLGRSNLMSSISSSVDWWVKLLKKMKGFCPIPCVACYSEAYGFVVVEFEWYSKVEDLKRF